MAVAEDFLFNSHRGTFGYYSQLPGSNDALVFVLLDDAGRETDGAMADRTNLASLLSASTECTALNYTRLTLNAADITRTVDEAADNLSVALTNLLWTNLGDANSVGVGKLIIAYDPDTTAGDDTQILPLGANKFVVVPDGTSVSALWDPAGMYLAESP